MDYSYKHLEHFIVIAEELSFSKAAILLKVAQPALSKQIKELEQNLGCDLFIRDRKELILTTSGQVLLQNISASFKNISEIIEKIKTDNLELTGEIKIGCLMEIGKNIIAPILKEFHKKNPSLFTNMIFKQANQIEEDLKKGLIEIAILPYPLLNENIRCFELFDEDCMLYTSKQNSKNRFDLKSAKFITYRDHDPLLLSYLQKFYPKAQLAQLQIALKANSHQIMIDWLKDFPYYCVLPIHATKEIPELASASSSILKNKIYLAFREETNQPKRVSMLQDYLRSKLKISH